MSNDLTKLREQYEKLGREIAALEKPRKQEVYGCLAGLENRYVVHVADKQMKWQEAKEYAESIGMRLPTKLELQLIAEATDEFDNLGWVWSSSTPSNNTVTAWYVYLNSGYTSYYNKNFSSSVLCVSF